MEEKTQQAKLFFLALNQILWVIFTNQTRAKRDGQNYCTDNYSSLLWHQPRDVR